MATVVSDPTTSAEVTLSGDVWVLSDPLDDTTVRAVNVAPGWAPTTARESAVFSPRGRDRKVVVWGDTYGVESQLTVYAMSKEEYDAVKALLLLSQTLLLRTIWGQAYYLAVVGGIPETPFRAGPLPGEAWGLRHAHTLSAPVVEVDVP